MWLPALSAALGIVAFLPFNLYPVSFIFLVPLFIFFVHEQKLWRMVAGTILFRFIFSMGTIYFTLEPILWISSLLIFCGLPISLFIFKKFWRGPEFSFFIVMPIAFALFDLAQAQFSLIPTFIFSAGNALGSSPFLGLATLGGLVFLTFFMTVVNMLVTAIVLNYQHNRLAIVLVILLFSGWWISQFELNQNAVAYSALQHSLTVATVSTNRAFTATNLPQLVQELGQQKVDLIIFPENMMDIVSPSSDDGLTISETFQNLARELHASVLATYDTMRGRKKYMSAVLFNAEGEVVGTHNKSRLTFAGEYWPFSSWRPSFYDWLRKKDPNIGEYAVFDQQNALTAGEQNLLSMTVAGEPIHFAVPICLEIHYPADLSSYKTAGARFIVNPSSNRWLTIGSDQFFYLTNNMKKIESVSLKLPIISSGVNDFAGVTLPNDKSVQHHVLNKNYIISFDTVRY